jgi:hypothetical protein
MNPNDVREQQIVISEAEMVALREVPTEGWIRSKYNIPYSELPYCYSHIWIGQQDDPLAGAYMFLFRDKRLTDSRRRAWSPSPSTADRERRY